MSQDKGGYFFLVAAQIFSSKDLELVNSDLPIAAIGDSLVGWQSRLATRSPVPAPGIAESCCCLNLVKNRRRTAARSHRAPVPDSLARPWALGTHAPGATARAPPQSRRPNRR